MHREESGKQIARLLKGAWRSPSEASLCPLTPTEFAHLAPILHGNGSAGLAWWRTRDTEVAGHPAASLLHDGFRQHTLRTRLLEKQLTEVLPFFRDGGVEPVLGKGWGVGRLYPEPGLRPYGDLDFLVHPKEWARAQKLLSDPRRPVAPLELHDNFRQLRDRKPEDLVARARVEVLNGVEVRILAPEDHLRLLALHGLTHGVWRPLWLCDVAVFLEEVARDPGSFDWQLFMTGDPWRSAGVRCALGLARDLLGADLETAGAAESLCETTLPGWMAPAALQAWGAPKHYLHMEPAEHLGRPLGLLEAARLRWANPIEVTYRRRAPWNGKPRLPYQLVDYLVRGAGFMKKVPAYLEERRGGEAP